MRVSGPADQRKAPSTSRTVDRPLTCAVLAVAVSLAACSAPDAGGRTDPLARKAAEWVTWGGSPYFTRYSALAEIDRSNVGRLEIAWRWQAEPLLDRPDSNWKATPLYVDGMLYVPTGGT